MNFEIQLASPPDRDDLVAEIWWNNQMVAEIRSGANGVRFIDLYPSPSRTPWSFTVDEWLQAIQKANRRLD